MKLYKRPGSPFYQISYVDPASGKPVRLSTKTANKAHAQAQFVTTAKRVNDHKAGTQETTLGKALEGYVSALAARGKASAKQNGSFMRKLLGRLEPAKPHPWTSRSKLGAALLKAAQCHKQCWHLDPEMKLQALTPMHLESLILERTSEGLKAASIAAELRLLRAATKYAEGLGYVAPAIKSWRIPQSVNKTRFLSAKEFAAVLKELDRTEGVSERVLKYRTDAKDLLIALALLGGRWSEVATMRWDKVDLAGGVVSLWGNKTGKERVVPIPPQVHAVLTRRQLFAPPGSHSPYVFPLPDGKPRVAGCRLITDAMDRAGCNAPEIVREHGRATIHSLRHTYASWLLAGGADLADVQGALGHTTLQMTRRYSHLTKGEALSRLSVAMSRALPCL